MKNTYAAFLRGVAWGIGFGCFARILLLLLFSSPYVWGEFGGGGNQFFNVYTLLFLAVAALVGGLISAVNCAIDNANPNHPSVQNKKRDDEAPIAKPRLMKNAPPAKFGCVASGCAGVAIGGGVGCLLPVVGFIVLMISDPQGDPGGPLLWPILVILVGGMGAVLGGIVGAVIGLVRLSRAKKPDGNEPPIARL